VHPEAEAAIHSSSSKGAPPPRGAPPPEGDGPDRIVAFAARALGSALRLTVRLPDPAAAIALGAADSAWDEVRAEFEAVDAALSRFRDDSELTRLNRLAGTGGVVRVSWRLRRALVAADRAARITDGRFDASVLGALERIGERGADLAAGGASSSPGSSPASPPPADAAIADQPGRLVHVPGVPLDMGGIGKGLALRWARDRALRALPPGAGLLLDAGGDLLGGGEPPAGGWLVGVEDPAAPDPIAAEPLVVVAVGAGSVATSSVRVRNWLGPDGRPVHHLVDPRTGDPARTGLIAVTVAAPDPAWAEVWSKALFLTGRDGIAEEARARGLAAWWVDVEGRLGMTPEGRIRTAWAAESRLGQGSSGPGGPGGPA
jgi:thiamine biosynthesis lipoprotein